MKPASAKAKGSRCEREFALLFGAKRNPGSGAWGGNDITQLPAPYDGLAVEVKCRAKLPAIATAPLAQAAYAARGSGRLPAVGYREDHGRWIVAMYAEDFRSFTDAVYQVGQGAKVRSIAQDLRRLADALGGVK